MKSADKCARPGVVYILEREDGLCYVGITVNYTRRLKIHEKSLRFSKLKLLDHQILFAGTYEECEKLESYYIWLFDTYHNGLNETEDGKGKSSTTKFNTLGKVYSEESRRKMSESNWMKRALPHERPKRKGKPIKITEKRRKDCEMRKNKDLNPSCKIKTTQVREIQDQYAKFEITKDLALKYCKKSHIPLIENDIITNYEEATNRGGSKLNRRSIFCHEICHVYNCTPTWISRLLDVAV